MAKVEVKRHKCYSPWANEYCPVCNIIRPDKRGGPVVCDECAAKGWEIEGDYVVQYAEVTDEEGEP